MKINRSNWFGTQAIKFDKNRYGAMALMMTFQSCFGSVAAMLAMKDNNYILLAFCAMVTMGANGAFIALAPAKWCVGVFYLSVLVNLIVIAMSLMI